MHRNSFVRAFFLAGAAAPALLMVSSPAAAGAKSTETVLYSFTGGADGGQPQGRLIADTSGALYGTAVRGGNTSQCAGIGCGTVFKVTPPASGQTAWTYATLYSFSGAADGAMPMAGLIMDARGNLYGTARQGGGAGCGGTGCGTVFMLSAPAVAGGAWGYTQLYSFSGPDGAQPLSELTQDASGNLLGTTARGGAFGHGAIFRLDAPGPSGWKFEQLYSFTGGADGGYAAGPVTLNAGAAYGTATYGGATGAGVVYQLAPPSISQNDWTLNVLFNLPGNAGGGYPRSALSFDSAGNLYGTATNIAFLLAPQTTFPWPVAILHAFTSFADANIPFAGLAEFVYPEQTAFYGTAAFGTKSNEGAVYKLIAPSATNPDWTESLLYAFSGKADGSNPIAGALPTKGGAIYGVTAFGGNTALCDVGCGVIYSIAP